MTTHDDAATVAATQRTDREGSVLYLVAICIVAALGGLLFGFDIAIITGAGPFLIEHFHLNDLSLGWAFSSLLFGCAIGSAVAGRIADARGRRMPLVWVALLFALTSVATGAAPTFTLFIAARLLGGVAVGGASVLAPMYVAEVSPPAMRGRMGALYQLAIVTGILVSYCINYWLHDLGPWNWRWMFISGVVPSLVFLVMLLFAPETPRYLFKAGREDEAFEVLIRIGGSKLATVEMEQMRVSFAEPYGGWSELLRPGLRRAVIVGFCLAILVHVSGINTIIDYAPIIFRSAGWKIDAALFSTFIIGITNLAFTIVSFWTIDRFGRRALYIAGSIGMAAALLLLMVSTLADRFSGVKILVLILLYLAFFASCIGPVFWTLVAEIFPNHVRGTAMVVPVLTQWVANAMVVFFFPAAFNQLGKSTTFAFLLAMCLLQAFFAWCCVPETKGRTLEEIERYWKEGRG